MTTEAQTKEVIEKPVGEGTPPAALDTKTKEEPAKKPALETQEVVEAAVKKPKVLADDDDEVQDDDDVVMSARSLKNRMTRNLKKALKESVGVDSLDALKEMKQKLDAADAAAEEKRLATLSETDRERELRKTAERERDELRTQIEQMQVSTMVREQAREVSDAASSFVKAKFVKHASREFADHIREMDDKMIRNLPDTYIASWMEKYATENPELAVAAATTETKVEEKPTKILVNNGANVQKPSNGAGAVDSKPKSDKEWQEFKNSSGLNF